MHPVAALRRWLFQLDHVEPDPIRLNQRRIFILPTRLGLLYGVVLVVMYLGAVNYNLGLGHALVFLLVSLGGVGMVHTFQSLFRLEISAGRCEPCFVGQPATFEVLVHNPDGAARPAIELAAAGGTRTTAELPARGTARLAVSTPATHRGWLAAPSLTLESRFPVGLFRAWSYPRPPLRVLVYPQPVTTPLPPPQAAARAGRRGDAAGDEDFSGFRQRQDADPLHHVAWKAYARTEASQPLLIKQFSGGLDRELWLDLNLLPRQLDLEIRLSRLTGWLLAAEARGLAYGLRLGSQAFPPARGARHRARCLEALALFSGGEHAQAPTAR